MKLAIILLSLSLAPATAQAPAHVVSVLEVSRHKNDIATGTELTVKGVFAMLSMPSDDCLSHLTWHTTIQHGEVDPCKYTRWRLLLTTMNANGERQWPASGLACDLTQQEWMKLSHDHQGNYNITVRGRYADSLDFESVAGGLEMHMGVPWLIDCGVVSIEAPPRVPDPDGAARKATELKAEKDAELKLAQGTATEKLKQLVPQYKQAISQLGQLSHQLRLADQHVADFRQQQTQNMYAAAQAHRAYIGQQTPSTLTQHVDQLAQEEKQVAEATSQLAGRIFTQEMTIKGKPLTVTVSSTEYRTLTLHMADAKVQREVDVLVQLVSGPDNEACITDIDNDLRVCTAYSEFTGVALNGDYRLLSQKLNAVSYEVSAN